MAETEIRKTGCEVCGKVDNHPRVVHPLPVGDPRAVIEESILDALINNGISGAMLRELQDPSAVVRHHDCCVAVGCPVQDGESSKSCSTILKETKGEGKTGDSLRSLLTKAGG